MKKLFSKKRITFSFVKATGIIEPKKKKEALDNQALLSFFRLCSGNRTRTYDLRVMSPTSYHCSIPHRISIAFQKQSQSIILATLLKLP